jgi:hypothetical protein
VSPGAAAKLHTLMGELARISVTTEQKKSLLLLATVPGRDVPIRLGYVDFKGRLWTDNVLPSAPPGAARQYLATLAALIGGKLSASEKYVITRHETTPLVADFLDVNKAGWISAIETFIAQSQQLTDDDRHAQ